MDSIFANVAFASQIGVSYPLLSDKGGIVTRRYGLFNPSIYAARRATFVIDKNGKIVDIQLDHEALNASKTARALQQLRKCEAQPGRAANDNGALRQIRVNKLMKIICLWQPDL
jgi:peroxiredoxin